jgi:hypothetical protein
MPARALDDFASKGPEAAAAAAADRFIITINLGADHVETYNKSISINAEDVVPGDVIATPQRPLPVANKRWDSDGDDCNNVVAAPVIERETSKKPAKTPVKTPIAHQSTGAVEHEAIVHAPVEIITDSRSAYEIALASLMEKG